jgi:hypothetical protein
MGGFCRQNSLENPPLRHDANACDWNPSVLRDDPEHPKYASISTTNKNRIIDSVTVIFIGFLGFIMYYPDTLLR